jgi:hypothetical protein
MECLGQSPGDVIKLLEQGKVALFGALRRHFRFPRRLAASTDRAEAT